MVYLAAWGITYQGRDDDFQLLRMSGLNNSYVTVEDLKTGYCSVTGMALIHIHYVRYSINIENSKQRCRLPRPYFDFLWVARLFSLLRNEGIHLIVGAYPLPSTTMILPALGCFIIRSLRGDNNNCLQWRQIIVGTNV